MAMASARLKVLPEAPTQDQDRWLFSQVGLSYRVDAPDISSSIIVSRLKRTSDGIHADIRVIVDFEGVKTGKNGLLHAARFNLTSSQTRKSLAKLLEGDAIDEAAALAQAQKVTSIEQQIKQEHLGMLIRIKNQLTPEQQAKLREVRPNRRRKQFHR